MNCYCVVKYNLENVLTQIAKNGRIKYLWESDLKRFEGGALSQQEKQSGTSSTEFVLTLLYFSKLRRAKKYFVLGQPIMFELQAGSFLAAQDSLIGDIVTD